MSTVGQSERATQDRVIALFGDELDYRYLGDWRDRDGNTNIEEHLTAYLTRAGYSRAQIARAIHALHTEADNPARDLLHNNQAVYSLLRYGVPVKIEAARPTETVGLINWAEPLKNDFAITEEVTLRGNHERRPDNRLMGAAHGCQGGTLRDDFVARHRDWRRPQRLQPTASSPARQALPRARRIRPVDVAGNPRAPSPTTSGTVW
jgi:hypothetical protein